MPGLPDAVADDCVKRDELRRFVSEVQKERPDHVGEGPTGSRPTGFRCAHRGGAQWKAALELALQDLWRSPGDAISPYEESTAMSCMSGRRGACPFDRTNAAESCERLSSSDSGPPSPGVQSRLIQHGGQRFTRLTGKPSRTLTAPTVATLSLRRLHRALPARTPQPAQYDPTPVFAPSPRHLHPSEDTRHHRYDEPRFPANYRPGFRRVPAPIAQLAELRTFNP